jgi:hypothetical protein
MATLTKYLYGIVGLVVGLFLAFFVCHEFDINPFNDEDDSHVLEFSTQTTYTPRVISIQPPSVKIDAIPGQDVSDSEQVRLSQYRTHIPNAQKERNPSVGLKAGMIYELPNVAGLLKDIPSISIDPRSDKFFKTEFTAERPLITNVTLEDTSFTHTQMVKYHFLWYTHPGDRMVYGFQFDPSPIEAIVVDRNITTTVFKRTWLRVSPEIGTNALNTSEWFAKVNLAISYGGGLWVKGSGELPMKKDPKLSLPVSLEYDLITLER